MIHITRILNVLHESTIKRDKNTSAEKSFYRVKQDYYNT